MRIATFNLQHLRLRGSGDAARLDGARDGDAPRDGAADTPGLDRMDRTLGAQVLARLDADVVALQEVFDARTLDHFHDNWLLPEGAAPYPHRVCIEGNDGRSFDVALMSRLPLEDVRSHAALTAGDLGIATPSWQAPDRPVFRRDCLHALIGALHLYICHFKAPYPDPALAWEVRRLEAEAVRRLVERDTGGDRDALWLVAGDLNEHGDNAAPDAAIAPLLGSFGVDLLARLPVDDRWTYRDGHGHGYSTPDALIASPALAARYPDAQPFLERSGMAYEATRHDGPRLPGVGGHRPHASDHAALAVDFPAL